MNDDWLRSDDAALWLNVSLGNLRVIATRRQWRRIHDGGVVAYWFDDVAEEVDRRATLRRISEETAAKRLRGGNVRPG